MHSYELQTVDFVRVLTYLDYADFETLRNCCWFLHNLTKRYRNRWQVLPMRAEQCPFVVYAFLRRARFISGLGLLSHPAHASAGT